MPVTVVMCQVNVDSSYGRDKLQFLLSVLSPLLECYHVVAGHVETLINNPLAGEGRWGQNRTGDVNAN